MKSLVYITSNPNKAKEMKALLPTHVSRQSLQLEEIQSMDVAEVAGHKAREAYRKVKRPVLVEDVGFYIEEWKGFPGPFIKWVDQSIGYAKLPKLIGKNRNMEWVSVLALFDGKKLQLCIGRTKGKLARKQKGRHGWGFDSIFIPEGAAGTYAQLDETLRNKFSARAKATAKLISFLKKR